jgi:purine nucleoside permease
MRPFLPLLLLAMIACAANPVTAQDVPSSRPVEIKVVVINMFEVGADTGDAPGEYQYWVEREHLDTVLPLPAGYHDLRLNEREEYSAY